MSTRPDKYHPKSRKAKEQARSMMLTTLVDPILNQDPDKIKEAIQHCKQGDTPELLAIAATAERVMRLISMSFSIDDPEKSKLWWPDEVVNEEKIA